MDARKLFNTRKVWGAPEIEVIVLGVGTGLSKISHIYTTLTHFLERINTRSSLPEAIVLLTKICSHDRCIQSCPVESLE